MWVDFPDVIGLCGRIEVFSTLHDVNQAVVCEIGDSMGQVGESSVEESGSRGNQCSAQDGFSFSLPIT